MRQAATANATALSQFVVHRQRAPGLGDVKFQRAPRCDASVVPPVFTRSPPCTSSTHCHPSQPLAPSPWRWQLRGLSPPRPLPAARRPEA